MPQIGNILEKINDVTDEDIYVIWRGGGNDRLKGQKEPVD